MINIGVIGFGYWGPNLVRNFSNVSNAKVVAIAESRQERKSIILKSYPNITVYNEAIDLIKDPKIDAVVIATPVFTHFELAKNALSSGKHVLLEKPMTSNSSEAEELISLSKRLNLTLMVDHTFLYTGAVNTMKNLILDGEIGKLQYFDSTRINLGLFQSDVNVLWDLAPHDISILKHLISEKPVSVNATGISHTQNGIENIAYMTINYQSNFIAHFNCSWTSPVKVRSTLIGGDKKMLVYNDLEPSEKIRVYDTGFKCKNDEEKNRILVDYRVGDIFIPKLETKEALLGVANDFVDSINQNKEPIASSILGLEVVEILESAQKSIKLNGKEITLK
jgi:predicted dehydrogenase